MTIFHYLGCNSDLLRTNTQFLGISESPDFWGNRVANRDAGWILRDIHFGLFWMCGDFFFILAYWGVNWKVGCEGPDRSE